MAEQEKHVVVPFGLYVAVWAALIALTAVTVGASYLHLGNVAVLTAVLIAAGKATLVLLYFMHLRWEGRAYFVIMLVVILTYVAFLVLTFSDYGLRA